MKTGGSRMCLRAALNGEVFGEMNCNINIEARVGVDSRFLSYDAWYAMTSLVKETGFTFWGPERGLLRHHGTVGGMAHAIDVAHNNPSLNIFTVATFRHPVDREISLFNHRNRHRKAKGEAELSWEEYLEKEQVPNHMTRILAGPDDACANLLSLPTECKPHQIRKMLARALKRMALLDLVLVTEREKEMMKLFREKLGWFINVEDDLIGRNRQGKNSSAWRTDPSAHPVAKRLLRENSLDIVLWETANKMMDLALHIQKA
eukprot:CAMPEP_0167761118 /NCGR_PEP_ID=MMETSP0110_2-20121227/11982_1 /TAXON_ID=629695 /ORGANISM="Gymnochlora sp., Strain CCMP2014" /LENGTH=260 /DNA_ID=CAMNT_0007647741 /DNA_START=328 /DNA_END=1110 /DNA_ORIENTATION=-